MTRPNGTIVPCRQCGRAIYRPPYRLQPTREHFCTNACRSAWLRSPARFWSRADRASSPHGCWLWTGPLDRNGFASAAWPGLRLFGAARIARYLTHGPIGDGLDVCHSCDVCYPRESVAYRACINPAHLYVADARQNARHMVEAGRQRLIAASRRARGERSSRARLTAAQVRAIRAAYLAGGTTAAELARRYGVTANSIRAIILGKNWRHVE